MLRDNSVEKLKGAKSKLKELSTFSYKKKIEMKKAGYGLPVIND